ncbi:hypothetical protein DT73_17160 [Mangrovibacter sp. MFB070]|uniref:YrhA family protein n=1 Tax=Mangrovibacter sp. MFB070 TaxID=1224318 RepID=UPI0004D438B7|nr:YrhA family protein [Mangrovibacter sp. MFB070]KEA51444.1 hypothetical protein DT73_17160 [Mangrovibacter sp. MFB070]
MNDTKQCINQFKKLMVADKYHVTNPVPAKVMSDLMQSLPPADWDETKQKVFYDIQKLLSIRPEYAQLFNEMDGLEYNGLTIYSLAQAENGIPSWDNIYIQNLDNRDNDIYASPHLTDKIIIGEDGMSVFCYNFTDNVFEIRDRVAPDYVIESHKDFADFLTALYSTVC